MLTGCWDLDQVWLLTPGLKDVIIVADADADDEGDDDGGNDDDILTCAWSPALADARKPAPDVFASTSDDYKGYK